MIMIIIIIIIIMSVRHQLGSGGGLCKKQPFPSCASHTHAHAQDSLHNKVVEQMGTAESVYNYQAAVSVWV